MVDRAQKRRLNYTICLHGLRQVRIVSTSHPDFEQGTLFLVNDDEIIRIEECDDGLDFTLYEPWSMKERDGGQLDRPDMTKEESIREIYQWYYPEKSKEK